MSEPDVHFDTPAINFGRLLIGARGRISVKLVNREHLPFSFRLDKSTYDASEDVIRSTGETTNIVTMRCFSVVTMFQANVLVHINHLNRPTRTLQ